MVRCELDGVLTYKGEELLLSIKALNEFDPKVTGASRGSLWFVGHRCAPGRASAPGSTASHEGGFGQSWGASLRGADKHALTAGAG